MGAVKVKDQKCGVGWKWVDNGIDANIIQTRAYGGTIQCCGATLPYLASLKGQITHPPPCRAQRVRVVYQPLECGSDGLEAAMRML